MNDDGKLDQLLNEMMMKWNERFKIDILGASETHWTADTQEAFEHQNFVILQAGRNYGLHRQGVALIINKEFSKSMTSYQAISERLICATFNTVEGPTTVFQTYTLTAATAMKHQKNFMTSYKIKSRHYQETTNTSSLANSTQKLVQTNRKTGQEKLENMG